MYTYVYVYAHIYIYTYQVEAVIYDPFEVDAVVLRLIKLFNSWRSAPSVNRGPLWGPSQKIVFKDSGWQLTTELRVMVGSGRSGDL